MFKSIPLLAAAAVIGTSPALPIASPEPSPQALTSHVVMNFHCGGSYLGVFIYDVGEERNEELGISADHGALIDRVVDGSPAQKAGLQEKDVITGWNGGRVEGVRQLMRLVKETPPGRTVMLDVLRNGATMQVNATIGKRMCDDEEFSFFIPDLDSTSRRHIEALRNRFDRLGERWDSIGQVRERREIIVRMSRPKLGVKLQSMTPVLERAIGAEGRKGALVNEVIEDSPAQKGGLEAGDYIIAIDGDDIESISELQRVIRAKEGVIDVKVLREGSERSFRVDLGSRPQQNAQQPSTLFDEADPDIE